MTRFTGVGSLPARGVALLLAMGLGIFSWGEEDADSQDQGTIAGQLVGPDNAPVAGANVRLFGRQHFNVTSDNVGRFRLDGVPVGAYRLWANKADLTSDFKELDYKGSSSGEPAAVTLAMRVGKQVVVTVRSEDTNDPIPDARVYVRFPYYREQKTGEDGVAIVRALMPRSVEFRIESPGRARECAKIAPSEADQATRLSVSLPMGGVVHGKVLDKDGQPIPDASVVYRVDQDSHGYSGDAPRTNADGTFRHSHLPLNASIKVYVRSEKHIRQEKLVTLTAEKREQLLEFTLAPRPPGDSVAGFVKDNNGRPIAGATIENYGGEAGKRRIATTDEQGRFLLQDLYQSYVGYEITVRADGYAPLRRKIRADPMDGFAKLQITLEPGHTIQGRVEDQAGKPIERASVSYNRGFSSGGLGGFTRTDSQGRFEFNSLPEDCEFRISADGFSTLSSRKLKLDGSEIVKVVLEPMGELRGRVVDASTGKPIKQFNVRLGFSPNQVPGDPRGGYSSRLANPGIDFTSDDGTFAITKLVNRMPFAVSVQASGYHKHVTRRVVASNAPDAPAVKISLEKIDPSTMCKVVGQIVDSKNRPVPDAELRLLVLPQPSTGPTDNSLNWLLVKRGELADRTHVDQFLTLVSDDKGRFSFSNILPGKHLQLTYWGENVPQGRVELDEKTEAGETRSIRVELPEPAKIIGTIAISKFPNAGGIRAIRLRDAWHQYEAKLKEGQTDFDFDCLPPGEYSVVVMSKPQRVDESSYRLHALANETVAIRAGQTVKVRFEKPKEDH